MAENRVLTAPLAIIKVNGIAIGKMKGIRVNESIQRGRVSGLGQLTPDELPALAWDGTLTCDFYNVDFKKSMIPNAIDRNVNTLVEWVDNVLLQEDGVQIDIYKKVKDSIVPDNTGENNIIKGKLAVYATVQGCFLDAENFDITEGAISGRNQSFKYIFPILFKG